MTTLLETVEKSLGEPRSAVIWLHGLGADGNDFVPIIPELQLNDIRFVFPHAPVRPVTLNSGMPCRAWFDITTLDHREPEALDRDGLENSLEQVRLLIERECERGIEQERIVLAGFSQGGAVALATGIYHPQPLAGIIGLSTWAPFSVPDNAANQATPVFLGHGEFDPLVSPVLGEQTRDTLNKAGMSVEWHSYPMAHAVCPQEIQDIAAFLAKVLS